MTSPLVLKSKVLHDDITKQLSRSFDYKFTGETTTTINGLPQLPETFGIGVIVGPSGSGKSTLMRTIGDEEPIKWDSTKSVASHFDSAEDATVKLGATGLNTIPTWMRPYHVLSTGERFRADLARRLKDGAVVDEYTSVVDRNVAKSASVALHRYVKKTDLKNLLLVTCHYDVLEWLQPDWVYDTATQKFHTGRYLHRPEVRLRIYRCEYGAWEIFKKHHYLTGKLNKSARCYLTTWEKQIVAFHAIMSFPHPVIKKGWRVSRAVVLPDFQGMGIGTSVTEALGDMYLEDDCRFFIRSSHPGLIRKRRREPWKWKEGKTYGNEKRTFMKDGTWEKHGDRPTTGFEYLGKSITEEEWENRLQTKPKSKKDECRYTDEKRCTAILDSETQRRCKCPRVHGTEFCHVHGPNAKEWHSKGGTKAGAIHKKFWQERQKMAKMIKSAENWPGYKTLVLAAIGEEYCSQHMDKKALAQWFQRLEKILIAEDERNVLDRVNVILEKDDRKPKH